MSPPYAFTVVCLSASVVLQVAAAVVAWNGLRRAGRFRLPWLCLSSAMLLMVSRRLMPLSVVWVDAARGVTNHAATSAWDGFAALLISALLLAGVKGLHSLFITLENQASRLLQLSESDPLTGLRNRRSMTRDALRELQRANRTGGKISALMLDLDHFKAINDRHGHPAGDAALAELAHALQGQLREVDLVARWGGEEFLVLLPDTDADGAERVAERLRTTVASTRVSMGRRDLHVTSSIGAATLHGGHRATEEALAHLIGEADQALYVAKHRGRNRVACYECAPAGDCGGVKLVPAVSEAAPLDPVCRHLLGEARSGAFPFIEGAVFFGSSSEFRHGSPDGLPKRSHT
ncbi:MAG: GGDEF domain-containing protein [Candidatus Eisenbacteria bacterium]|nr:GGDEF domain-containing protein [Candidatus Eisenbacteria bacterium]